ncbi:MAG: PASTA domain-containing protein, partial [Oscillospiraceae bacterium]
RDVKPQNIMLLNDGTIKVTDFGIARFARSEQKTITDKAIGSVHYISPEQARGDATDEKADIYSVGVMLYEMLTGKLPFEAASAVSVVIMQLQNIPVQPSQINPSIPQGLEQITMHAMEKDAQKRYMSAAEMLRDLEEFRRDPTIVFEYNCFVDNSPTKYIGDKADFVEEEEPPRKSPIVPVLAGVAGAFVVAIIVLAVIFLPKLFGSSGPSMQCPNFVGMNYNDLVANPEYSKLNFEVTYDHSAEYATGIIFAQKPEADKPIKSKQKITITVSMGQKTVTIPDVYNYDIAAAVTALKAEGFTVKTVYKPDDEISKDRIIATFPVRNATASEGSEVELYVSSGATIIPVDVPNIVGMDEAAAKAEIQRCGLTVGKIEYVDNAKPKGIVISQDPSRSSTAQIGKGSSITFKVSTGVVPTVEYEYEFKLKIPSDMADQTIKVVVYIDGTYYLTSEELLIDSLTNRSYVFNIKTTKASGTVNIRFEDKNGKSYRYRNYSVNFKDADSPVPLKPYHDEYNKKPEESDTSSSGSSKPQPPAGNR